MVCVKITKQTLPPKPSRIYAIHSQKYTPRVNVHLRVLFHGAGGRRYLHERRCTIKAPRLRQLEKELAAAGTVERDGIKAKLSRLVAHETELSNRAEAPQRLQRLQQAPTTGRWGGTFGQQSFMSSGHIVEHGLLAESLTQLKPLLHAGRGVFWLHAGRKTADRPYRWRRGSTSRTGRPSTACTRAWAGWVRAALRCARRSCGSRAGPRSRRSKA